jgi:hypothetical protein
MTTAAKLLLRFASYEQIDWPFVIKDWGLYDAIEDWAQTKLDMQRFLGAFLAFDTRFDLHCEACGRDSVFTSSSTLDDHRRYIDKNYPAIRSTASNILQFTRVFSCGREPKHKIVVELAVIDSTELLKIGQFPSLADLSFHDIDRFESLLGKDELAELKRGLGLFAHGIGIGSLIYLRRALEALVLKAEKRRGGDLGYDPKTTRMQDRIAALAGFLPAFLVENKSMYGTLSSGLHGLSEVTCRGLFPPCLEGIKIGLEELLDEANKVERAKAAALALQEAQMHISKLAE